MPRIPAPKPPRGGKRTERMLAKKAGRFPEPTVKELSQSLKRGAKQGANDGVYRKFRTGSSKLAKTNSPIKASVPLKPSSVKANAAKKTSTSISAKYKALDKAPKNVKSPSAKSGAMNKMKAQGPKAGKMGITYSRPGRGQK